MNHSIFSLSKSNGGNRIKSDYRLLPKEYQEQIEVIRTLYENRYFIGLYDNRKKLRSKKDRTCRFCGKSYPEVKFSNKAHIVPELIGNKSLMSDFECDTCNWKFGVYENDFANYLGLYRTFAKIAGKKGIPIFKSRDNKLSFKHAFGTITDVLYKDLNDVKENITYDKNEKVLKVTSKGTPYKPINVFRCLLKSAISFVDEKDLKHLSDTLNFLSDDKYVCDPTYSSILTLHQFFVPGPVPMKPFIIYFKKREQFIGFPAPTMVFIFYIGNLVYQLFIPFYDIDSFLYPIDDSKYLYIIPPLIREEWINKFGKPFERFVNLNNEEIVENYQGTWIKYI